MQRLPQPAPTWIADVNGLLDGLERALLQADAPAVESASAAVQAALQQAPRSADLQSSQVVPLRDAARRFTQLRAATLRAAALNERALGSLLPDHLQKPTYGRPHAGRSLRG